MQQLSHEAGAAKHLWMKQAIFVTCQDGKAKTKEGDVHKL